MRRCEGQRGIVRLLCFLSCLILLSFPGCAGRVEREGVVISFIDVGQGSAALVETPDGSFLIDAGPDDREDYLAAYLDVRGIDELVWMILTHAHDDHVGGADRVLTDFAVGDVILPAYSDGTLPDDVFYRRLVDAAAEANVSITTAGAGDVFVLGEVSVQILSPTRDDYPAADGNAYSLVVRVVYGDCAVLIMGDAEAASEEEMLERVGADELRSDLIAVGHHGSSTSTTEALLDAVSPRYALISCGKNNMHGHPDARVLARLEERNITVFRTDREGSLVFACDGKDLVQVK